MEPANCGTQVSLKCLHSLSHYTEVNALPTAAVVAAGQPRAQVVARLFEAAFALHFTPKTAQLACTYFDLTAHQLHIDSLAEMQQLAACCLQVASKFEERVQIDEQTVSALAGTQLVNLTKLEAALLIVLDWQVDQVTAAEVARVALAFSAPSHDFAQVIKESDEFASISYTDSDMAAAGPVVIATAAVCCVFERRGLLTARDSWLDLVLPSLRVTRSDVFALCGKIWRYLESHFKVSAPIISESEASL